MGSKDDLQTALRSLRNVRRMARRLQRVPVDCLRVNSNDIADGLHRQGVLHRHYGAGRLHCYRLGGPSQRNSVDAGRVRRLAWRNLLDFQKQF